MPSPGKLLLAQAPKIASIKLVGEQFEAAVKPQPPVWRLVVISVKNDADQKELEKRLAGLAERYNDQTSTAQEPTPARVLIIKRYVEAKDLAKEKLPVGYTSLPV